MGYVLENTYPQPKGILLAALFDLFVSAQYYEKIANRGWTYCPTSKPRLLYPYTNVCPRCLSRHKPIFAKANKPESGQIGMMTTDILCEMLVAYFKISNVSIEVYKASEPIDVILYEPTSELLMISEVKAAPLITLPLSVQCERLTEEADGVLVNVGHGPCENPFLHNSELSLYFPATIGHKEKTFDLGMNWGIPDKFFHAIKNLCLANKKFLPWYFSYWEEAYQAYSNKEKENPIYWLTNGCGVPSPRPNGWPQRKSGGYESISDAKTSVGMDRTDDIKKGIYQVLKLGSEFKPKFKNVKTALISNVHAVRHRDEYLTCIKDIIWTIDETRKIQQWSQISADAPLYNLFDGIISFTESDIRDKEVERIFNFGQ